jgi:cyclic beta-1,2-glucan synthetase
MSEQVETENAAQANGAHKVMSVWPEDSPIRGEVYGLEHLEEHARLVASASKSVHFEKREDPRQRFLRIANELQDAHDRIAAAAQEQATVTGGAEWLLDNFYIVLDNLREVRHDLPGGYYRELPKLAEGPYAGLPRVYALALELVAHTDCVLDETTTTLFVRAYQGVTPLTIGELWAVPIMLRLGLLENLRRLAARILCTWTERKEAESWKVHFGSCREMTADEVDLYLQHPSRQPKCSWTDAFVVHLLQALRDLGVEADAGIAWLERHLERRSDAVHKCVGRENQRQASDQVSIGNAVTSLRLLGALDWAGFFEQTSLVDAELRRDPMGSYARQDFATRDHYRREIEILARGSSHTELEVARKAVELAWEQAGAGAQGHVGYFLIGNGRFEFEKALRYRARWRRRLQDGMRRHANAVYFGGIGALMAACLAALVCYAFAAGARSPLMLMLVTLATLPLASELAVSLINYLVARLLPPVVLPKMDFKDGVPEECPTFIVMPTMLLGPESGRELARRLEIHYLSNPDAHFRYALLTDFADASAEIHPQEEAWLTSAVREIRALNSQYAADGPDLFFLLHRSRRWNPSMNRWMGWERKRGKLNEFNKLLRGAQDTGFSTITGDLEQLPPIRYVITLDTDTRLPREAARRLVATMHHPLNRPRFDPASGRVVEGYGILQPRVSLPLTASRRSWFARVYSDSAGLDPYTTAVSDVYQDLFGRGSFTGKGIYEVDAFEDAVGETFPENHILSHDLIEGNYARCGLVTDVELLDEFPSNYAAYSRRAHRWARGDWQILPWLLGRTPGPEEGRLPNPLPLLERWKIFDNLRRTLVPPGLIILLFLGATVFPGSPWAWTAAVLALTFLPVLLFAVGSLRTVFKAPLRLGGPEFCRRLGATAGQSFLGLVFLAEQSLSMLNAAAHTLWRLFITKRGLLEWESALAAEKRLGTEFKDFLNPMWPVSACASAAAILLALVEPAALKFLGPFLFLWLVSPWVAYRISHLPSTKPSPLTNGDRLALRRLGRRTWGFFEKFVTAADNWLPPDNYQEDPKGEIAHRTSPTNKGLYLLSIISAHDLGYLTIPNLLERLENTFDTLEKLERRHGHFCNWYDTQTLEPLPPLYLSTVDSGNLLACLMVLRQALQEKKQTPLVSVLIQEGLEDTLALLAEALATVQPRKSSSRVTTIKSLESTLHLLTSHLRARPEGLVATYDWLRKIERLAASVPALVEQFGRAIAEVPEDLARWSQHFTSQIHERLMELEAAAPWLGLLTSQPDKNVLERHVSWPELRRRLGGNATPLQLASQEFQDAVANFEAEVASGGAADERTNEWLGKLKTAAATSKAGAWAARSDALVHRIFTLEKAMDFRILYNAARHLFSIGYNESAGKLDNSHYDLLASEACLTSFLAIARGEAPRRHWFQLGRSLAPAPGGISLVSWGGTMFEYLMPRLFILPVADTLLDESWLGAVRKQIEYGVESHVPWGVSESGFNALDSQLNYQYQAFGVPGLGLKRGLTRDLVVAPYATMLALPVLPSAARENLRRLAKEKALAGYGFYEAIDYTRDRLKKRRRSAIVRSFMAHHQGMGLIAINNCLNGDPMPRRFHAEPMVRASDLLLQERVPTAAPLAAPPEEELPTIGSHEPTALVSRRLTSADTPHPRVHLLSNSRYSVMVSNAGAGYSTWRDLDVTRWREDRVRDCHGQFLYIRDVQTHKTWSAGRHPMALAPELYEVVFSQDKADLRRVDANIESHLEITVCPESDAEVRRLTLTNHGTQTRELEVTSYAEVVLLTHGADAAHPCFGKLFLETEFVHEHNAILCRRRPRAVDQKPIWAIHVLALEGTSSGPTEYETDRARFLGRGRGPDRPAALEPHVSLSGATGAVLDPIFSLRRRVRIPAGTSASLAFTTAVAATRDEALALADQYDHFHGVTRAFELAWAHSQVELRHLHVTAEELHLYQRMAAHVIYAGIALRRAAAVSSNRLGQQHLWRFGISGDLPIVLLRLAEHEDLSLVRLLLRAHGYWRLKGLRVDLVLLNDHPASYLEALNEQVQTLIRTSDDHGWENKPGGVFLLRAPHLQEEERTFLQAVARAVFEGRRGSLTSQVDRQPEPKPLPARFVAQGPFRGGDVRASSMNKAPDRPAFRVEDLQFWNGRGGFTANGREYVILVKGQDDLPPAPWNNVIANRDFGCLVSEVGSGYSWATNSQQFRLTNWSNDPVIDPPADVIYFRDEDSGEFWTPTPLPAGGDATVVVRHGQGYTTFERTSHGLVQEITFLVAPADPVKVVRVVTRNAGSARRRLSAWYYTEWVLGGMREQAPMQVRCWHDEQSGALVARNDWQDSFANQLAFATAFPAPSSYSSDRLEFIGRNGSAAAPAALKRRELSKRIDPLADPCAAFRVEVELAPGEQKETLFFLGSAASEGAVRELIARYSKPAVGRNLLEQVQLEWNRLLECVSVSTPNPAFDLLMNRWLLYQVLSCRFWARTGFYQSSGAFGFRDQLQDVLALLHAAPQEARGQILLAASRQFTEGDVQHWWHPPSGRGVRTRISDDLLWLPYAVCQYLAVTRDLAILNEQVPYLKMAELAPEQEENYGLPEMAETPGSLYEHCLRALDKGYHVSERGLPFMGTGDWNDGMNRVGFHGKGESIWLGWFLARTLDEFEPVARERGDEATASKCRERAQALRSAVEAHGWDGAWYRRAYFDNGTPLGSATNDECQIDGIAQTWAVIAGCDADRGRQAFAAVLEKLVLDHERLIPLLTPPFDQGTLTPGYIKGYLPGIRENGGQYTHAATWTVLAAGVLGQGNRAVELFDLLNPILRTTSAADVGKYRVEPYVLAGDVYSHPPHVGRGGWTWYTGSAGWLYRIGLETILGIVRHGAALAINPCLASAWSRCKINYRYGSASYHITIDNRAAVERGVRALKVDGAHVEGTLVKLVDDGKVHDVRVEMGGGVREEKSGSHNWLKL